MAMKRSHTAHDRLSAQLVLIVVFGMLVAGALGLYMTGVFKPASGQAALADTEPLNLPTRPPKASILDWLFASAKAEGASVPQQSTTPEAPDLQATLESMQEAESEFTEADRVKVDRKDLAINKNLPQEWFNVLLLGVDSRGMDLENSRSDVMIVASINGKTGEVKLTSLARDLYVQIPNGVGNNRLNAAFAVGGWELSVKTINQLFELNIENYVAVTFHGMAALIDELGGVDIQITGTEYQYINENVAVSEDYEGFPKSTARQTLTEEDTDTIVHLDGLQAVAFARIRKSDDDLHRTSRQRMLVNALKDKVWPINLQIANQLMLTAGQYVQMQLSIFPSTRFGKQINDMIKLDSDITISELSVPIAGSHHTTTIQDKKGKDVVVLSFNMEDNVKALHEFIYGEYIPANPPK